ncbi:aldehyde dehydrogenase family protein [Halanaerobium sp. Z-7514]|uniref:Aldehyde dehydrogenase family protein n=1 Tax=Halanaerobium polyolivorans TaxID=2886943 RepID=A0AAW4X1Z0_9FIRM|nr:aldehyde dehydrogenase family protein [Halanaerobium polyolivorans]MCC3145817.1 aldehyde dehydrogenase family protein [Halanaerobium polyolivorans]RQD76613.1 MAG: aldehyde dehydrogenase family protein [Halanaerobium sp. MSAO_Bac5]
MSANIELMVKKSKEAQAEFEKNFGQEDVDQIIKDITKLVYDRAEEFAKMIFEETNMGVYEDKVKKHLGKSKIMWKGLRGRKSMGIIDRDEEKGTVTFAKPVGVVASLTPVTNPIVTAMNNIVNAIKGKNSIIVSPHPASKECIDYSISLFNEILSKYGAPENLVQNVKEPTKELTNQLMSAADVVVATGGHAMVKAAYSSGRPSYGVGQGNVQCIIDKGVDLKEAVPIIIGGRIFDNGIICSGEQTTIIPAEMYEEAIAEFKANNCYYVEADQEVKELSELLFPEGHLNKNMVGQPAKDIAAAAGIDVPEDTVMLLVKGDKAEKNDVLRKEKIFPVNVAYSYDDLDEAIDIAQTNLDIEGIGHSVAVHSNSEENLEKIAAAVKVSRVIVNAACSTTVGGSFTNGLEPTTTLGCGTWGNNSISENFYFKHLLNTTKIAYLLEDVEIPTDEEFWA